MPTAMDRQHDANADRRRVPPACLPVFLAALLGCSAVDRPGQESGGGESESVTGPEDWTLSATGFGQLRAGMSVAEAAAVLGHALPQPQTTECSYVRSASLPDGVLLMVENDTIRRVDVESSTVATEHGIRIGDREDRAETILGPGVLVLPHKYTSGHYLVVSATDTVYRLVVETDADTVTTMRGGLLPHVMWVEGCS